MRAERRSLEKLQSGVQFVCGLIYPWEDIRGVMSEFILQLHLFCPNVSTVLAFYIYTAIYVSKTCIIELLSLKELRSFN